MVSICPSESDPRFKVAEFVSDPEVTVLAGLVNEGIYVMMDVVQAEIEKQDPDARVMVFCKEYMVDNGVMTLSDLKKHLATLNWDGVRYILFRDDICVIRWPEAFSFLAGKGVSLFTAGYACRGVPVCVKQLNAFTE